METNKDVVSLIILDREYKVRCLNTEKENLENAAKYLDKKMRVIRDSGRVIGLERIAVLVALDMSYELLKIGKTSEKKLEDTQYHIELLLGKLNKALSVE